MFEGCGEGDGRAGLEPSMPTIVLLTILSALAVDRCTLCAHKLAWTRFQHRSGGGGWGGL